MHFSWVDALFEMTSENIRFEGKTVALFGAGDSQTHGEHFCSALGKFYQIFTKAGVSDHPVSWTKGIIVTTRHWQKWMAKLLMV